jgi:RHS repeat-associated protein
MGKLKIKLMKNRTTLPVSVGGVLLAGLLFCNGAMGSVRAAETNQPLAARISGSSVLYQPLAWVGASAPADAENQALWRALEIAQHGKIADGMAAMEQFVADYPGSAWMPSLRANLGRFCQEHALYSRALGHWEAAWAATRVEQSDPAKGIADFTLAYWSGLLGNLGQVDALGRLLEESQGRAVVNPHLRQLLDTSRSDYKTMRASTDVSFRCGSYALMRLVRMQKGPSYANREIQQTPAPVTGFSLAKLAEMGQRAGLDVVAARWGGERKLAVPSVVHWKSGHYGAIVAERNGSYEVADAALGQAQRWLGAGYISEEASGFFIVPRDKLPKDWAIADASEAGQVFGRGPVGISNDHTDSCANGSGGNNSSGDGSSANGNGSTSDPGSMTGASSLMGTSLCPSCGGNGGGDSDATGGDNCPICPVCGDQNGPNGGRGGGPFGPGPSGGGPDGGFGSKEAGSSDASGMPIWKVSEPYVNVWLYDQPLAYQPGLGEAVYLRLAYKQRDSRPIYPKCFNLGPNWNCSWLSYMQVENLGDPPTQMLPGGGQRNLPLNADGGHALDYFGFTLTTHIVGSPGGGGASSQAGASYQADAPSQTETNGYVVNYRNGARDYYQFLGGVFGAKNLVFLSAQVDPYGHTNRFLYDTDPSGVLRLVYVVDADGRTNSLSYQESDPSLISSVTDPFSHTTTFSYSNGVLVSITDPVGVASQFSYDQNNWITNLHTPYGNTVFEYFPVGQSTDELLSVDSKDWNLQRAVRVDDAAGGTNIYMLRLDSRYIGTNVTEYLPDYVTDPSIVPAPQSLPCGANGNPVYYLDNDLLYYRDTFHWGPRQAAGLPQDLTTFQVPDYIRARMRHWLHSADGNLGQTLSREQAPSPDGVKPGQVTWFDYDGKYYPNEDGTCSSPGLIARVLPDGTTWYKWFQRDDWGRPTNIVETWSTGYGAQPLTRSNVFVYDPTNNIDLLQVIGPQGELLAGYSYDTNHHVLTATNAAGDVTSYTYDTQGRLGTVHTPAGLTTQYNYFPDGPYSNWVQQAVDIEIGRTNSYTYTNDLVCTLTDERGVTTTNTWDGLGRLVRVDYPDGTFITNRYSNLDLVWTADRMGFTSSYGYDSLRRMLAHTNALGAYTLYNYCPCGALDSVCDAASNYTFFAYNNAGWRLLTTYPDGYMVNNTFDLLGQLVSVSDSGGNTVTNWFNNQGRLYAVSNAFGQVKGLSFDIEDRVLSSTDANGVTVGMTYDNLGRLLSRTYPDTGVEHGVERFGYSAAGLTAYTNQLGLATYYGYDAARRKAFETNANLEVTQFRYDPSGNLTNLIDGKSQSTFWKYDQYSRVTNKVDNLGTNLFIYSYDVDNRLTSRWSAARGNTAYFYDAVGNLTNVLYDHSAGITNWYDPLSRLTNTVDGVGVTRYSYDAVGQLLSEDGPWDNDTVSYTYTNRLRTSLSLAQPNAGPWVQGYGYDAMRRLTDIDSAAGLFTYGYAPSPSALTALLTLPSGAYITNSYDANARLAGTYLMNSGGVQLNVHSYGYNTANQRTRQTRKAGDYVDYTYDNIGQLISALGKESGGLNRSHEQLGYGYDKAGNLNSRTINALVQSFGVNSLNELTTVSRSGTFTVSGSVVPSASSVTVNVNGLAGLAAMLYGDNSFAASNFTLTNGSNVFTAIAQDVSGHFNTNTVAAFLPASVSYTYDLNGNLLSDGRRNFAYDDENQLVSVWVTNAWRSDFAYDGKMRRRVRYESSWNGTAWVTNAVVRYVYDGNVVLQERDTNNLPLVTYTRGRDLSGSLQGAGGIGGLLARTDNTLLSGYPNCAHAYYHTDGNGNVTCLASAAQVVVARYLYDPFGNLLSQSGPLADANLYRFSSKEWHQNSGSVYYLYRFYDPSLQRWLNTDPIGEPGFEATVLDLAGDLYDSPNRYLFVDNDPITSWDVFGLTRKSGEYGTGAAQWYRCMSDCKAAAKACYIVAGLEGVIVGIIGKGPFASLSRVCGFGVGASMAATCAAMQTACEKACEKKTHYKPKPGTPRP